MKRAALAMAVASLFFMRAALADTPPVPPPAVLPPPQPPSSVAAAPAPTSRLVEVSDEKEIREEREAETKDRAEERAQYRRVTVRFPISGSLGVVHSDRLADNAKPAFSATIGALLPIAERASLQGRAGFFVTPPIDTQSQRSTRDDVTSSSSPAWGVFFDATVRYNYRAFVAGMGPVVGYMTTPRSAYYGGEDSRSFAYGGGVLELGARFGQELEFEVLARPSLGTGDERLWGAQMLTFGWSPITL